MSWKSFLQEEPRLTLPQKWAYQLYLSHFHFGESIGCDRIAFARGWRPWTIIGYYGFMDGIWPQSFDQGHSIASVLICLRNFFSWFPVKEMQLLLRILLWFVLGIFHDGLKELVNNVIRMKYVQMTYLKVGEIVKHFSYEPQNGFVEEWKTCFCSWFKVTAIFKVQIYDLFETGIMAWRILRNADLKFMNITTSLSIWCIILMDQLHCAVCCCELMNLKAIVWFLQISVWWLFIISPVGNAVGVQSSTGIYLGLDWFGFLFDLIWWLLRNDKHSLFAFWQIQMADWILIFI